MFQGWFLRFRFANKKLAALYGEEKGAKRFPMEVVDAFFAVMAAVDAARSTQDLRVLKSLHFEKLKGGRGGQCSMRLGKQFRLVFEVVEVGDEEELKILEIVDYH